MKIGDTIRVWDALTSVCFDCQISEISGRKVMLKGFCEIPAYIHGLHGMRRINRFRKSEMYGIEFEIRRTTAERAIRNGQIVSTIDS